MTYTPLPRRPWLRCPVCHETYLTGPERPAPYCHTCRVRAHDEAVLDGRDGAEVQILEEWAAEGFVPAMKREAL